MAWIIFILGALMFWGGITGNGKGYIGFFCLTLWCLLASLIMFGSMYLRHLGW